MWAGEVSSAHLREAGRWVVSYFAKMGSSSASGFPMRMLRELVRERQGATDPQQLGDQSISYLGLEHVRSGSGELVGFAPRPANSVKSRSKVFRRGDVLFGRMRPELNKVYLAEGEIQEGICSTEFVVLIASEGILVPRFLRHVLASSFVTDHIGRFRGGAALPRINTADLLSISIPLPPLDVQQRMAEQLRVLEEELVELRSRVETLPGLMSESLNQALIVGNGELEVI
jgi:Type I restriction modification DNA specificity domain